MGSGEDRTGLTLTPELWQALIEEAPVGACLVRDGRVVYANRWLRDYTGYQVSATEQPDALSLVHPEDRREVAARLAALLAGEEGGPARQRERLIARDGSARDAELHARRVVLEGRLAVQVAVIDVGARVRAERSHQEHLAALEESSRQHLLFCDVLSHDLLNPVWVAQNYLALAMDGALPEPASGFLGSVQGALEKARGILADARCYLKLLDRTVPAAGSVELGPLVEEVAKSQRRTREGKRQTFALSLAPGALIGDCGHAREIVANLLSNAVKYSPPGAEIEVLVDAGPPVRLEVRDRGPGVPEQDRERVFRRFERLEKGPVSGVGLGLAIVQRAAQLHGARVRIEDHAGGGSVFVVEFPPADAG